MEHAKLNGRPPRRGSLVACAVGLVVAGTIATLAPTAAGASRTTGAVGSPNGFAAVAAWGHGGTTGGAGGPTVTVDTADGFLAAIARPGPLIIRVDGVIELPGPMHDVTSDKTIVGLGDDAGLTGGGLNIGLPVDNAVTEPPADAVHNVIVQNLTFDDWADDAINVQMFSHHVWIDHNTFVSGFDGAADVKRGSSYVTVSWNHSTHGKNMLVGHNPDNGAQDIGQLVPQMVSATFGKPVRVSLHPKFTVALGAAALAQAAITVPSPRTAPANVTPANVTPAVVPSATSTGRRPKWLLPAVGAAAALVMATTAILAGGSDSGDAKAGSSTSNAPPSSSQSRSAAVALPDLEVFTGRDVGPYAGLLGAAENGWASTALGAGRAVSNGSISAAPDGAKAIRVSWSGVGPAQFYVQRNAGSSDLRPYVVDSALVVDVVVHRPPTARTALAVHCVFPCAAELDASSVFRAIKPGQKRTLKIPVRCFTDAGLNAARVNTPFLVVTAGTFEASFGDVRWKAGAADDADATSCDDLR